MAADYVEMIQVSVVPQVENQLVHAVVCEVIVKSSLFIRSANNYRSKLSNIGFLRAKPPSCASEKPGGIALTGAPKNQYSDGVITGRKP